MTTSSGPAFLVGAPVAGNTVPELTTIFTPPASCLPPRITLETNPDDHIGRYTAPIYDECYPPKYWQATKSDNGSSLASWYSPGWCPGGYQSAGTLQALDSKTSVICCPDFATLAQMDWETDLGCIGPGKTLVYVMSGRTSTSTMPEDGPAAFNYAAPQINIVYEDSDVSLFTTTTSSTTSSTAMPSSYPSTVPSETASRVSSPTASSASEASTGLSTGAKAGIGVGAGLTVLVTALVVLFFVLRRRKRAAKSVASEDDFGKPELSGESAPPPHFEEKDGQDVNELSGAGGPGELAPDARAEMNGAGRPTELAPNVLVEMDSGWRGHEKHDERQ